MPSMHRCVPVYTYVFIFASLLPLGACQGDIDLEKAFRAGDCHVAHERWRLSVEQGDPEAQYYLGILYQLGLDFPRDYNKAVEWYRKAVLGGNADAQRHLAPCTILASVWRKTRHTRIPGTIQLFDWVMSGRASMLGSWGTS